MADSMIVVDFDSKRAVVGMAKMKQAIAAHIPKALLDTAFEALRLTQFEVPHDEGTLQNSGTVEMMGDDVIMGYNTIYAARLHEHPEFRFQKGRKGKYIEDPLIRNADALNVKFGRSVQMRLF